MGGSNNTAVLYLCPMTATDPLATLFYSSSIQDGGGDSAEPRARPLANLPLAPPCLCHLTSWGCALFPRALKVKRLECFSSTISFLHICTWWRSRFILILPILLLFSGVWISIPAYFFVYALSYKRRLLVFFFFPAEVLIKFFGYWVLKILLLTFHHTT